MLKTFEDKWTKKKDESNHVIEGYPQFSAGDHKGVIWLRKAENPKKLESVKKSSQNTLNHLFISRVSYPKRDVINEYHQFRSFQAIFRSHPVITRSNSGWSYSRVRTY